jgi:hypothetical protein
VKRDESNDKHEGLEEVAQEDEKEEESSSC